MKRHLRYKRGECGYPSVLIHEGCLHVTVSRQMESIEVLRVKPWLVRDADRFKLHREPVVFVDSTPSDATLHLK